MLTFEPLLAYLGPETILPLTSALAAAGGVLLIGWRHIRIFCRKVFRFILRKQA